MKDDIVKDSLSTTATTASTLPLSDNVT